MADSIEALDGALIQHGHHNDRVYLMKLSGADPDVVVDSMNTLAAEEGYTKLFAKVRRRDAESFLADGFTAEARAARLYKAKEDILFLGKFIEEARGRDPMGPKYREILNIARAKRNAKADRIIKPGCLIRKCSTVDAETMSRIYSSVYETYPFPIDEPRFIKKSMKDDTDYYCIECSGRMVSMASMDMDRQAGCAEVTDFATLGQYRGKGFATMLLKCLEAEARKFGITALYTIARAASTGMNIVFSRRGYAYGGRLVNNTNISGRIESMNVWHRLLEN